MTRAFDSMSNLRKETVEYASDDFTKYITHDRMRNPLVTTYPGGRVTHGYDELERIATIHSSQGGAPSTDLLAEYDTLGAARVEWRTLAGNGTRLDYGFNAIGRVNATMTLNTVTPDAVDYAADLQGYTTTQIDALAPARPAQGTFDS